MEERSDVVIVGGGLAGLSLAIGLADRGRSVTVLEARAGVKPVKRGLSLSPNGLQSLEKLRLADDVDKTGFRIHLVKYLKSRDELLVAYDYSLLKREHNHILTLLPHTLELLLRERALNKGVKLHERASFVGLLRESGDTKGVRATVAGVGSSFLAEVIVGADGAMSKVRESTGIHAEVRKYDHSYVVTVAGETRGCKDATHHLARGKMLGIFPLEHGSYVFYYLPTGGFEELKRRGLDTFKADLISLAPELDGPLDEISSWQDFLHMSPVQVKANSWVSDRVALLGDAVHALEPSLGQGANLSLQDVVALLDTLEQCFSEGDFSSTALKRYEETRRPHTELIQQMAEYASTYMNTDSRVIGWLRDRALKKTQNDQSLMLLGLEMASGMKQRLGFGEKLKLAGIL